MTGPKSPSLIALACCLVLSPFWAFSMFDRSLWTPDEPREADISWNMSSQTQHAVPTFAGRPFPEKPPLAYWAAGAAARAALTHDAALRAPNFVYAFLTTFAVVLLAAAMGGTGGTWIAGITFGTFLLSLQVSSWLGTDAALMTGVAGALLGAYCGVKAETFRRRLGWFTLLHASLAWAFLAKGPGGLLTPICGVLALLILERKAAVLKSAALWLPSVLFVSVALVWIMAVSRTTEGTRSLSVLLWSNVAGRFVHLDATEASVYSLGHPNYPGKYLIELPFYLAPWIFLFVAAVRRAAFRVRQADGTNWRFVLATLAGTVLALSFSATARGIYFAPALTACALLIGLWYEESVFAALRFDRAMLGATFWLIVAFAIVLFLSAAIVEISESDRPSALSLLAVGTLLCLVFLSLARHHLSAHRSRPFMTWLFLAYLVAFVGSASVLLPSIDRWQNLTAIALAVDRGAASRKLVLYQPDETTIAILERRTSHRIPAQTAVTPSDVDRLLGEPGKAVMLVLIRGQADGPVMQRLRSWGIRVPKVRDASAQLRELCSRLSLSVESVYEIPMGRRYALLTRSVAKQAE
jgi:4-amino-4-deoxy-L-arabinose transferase-like glycosyltransferase